MREIICTKKNLACIFFFKSYTSRVYSPFSIQLLFSWLTEKYFENMNILMGIMSRKGKKEQSFQLMEIRPGLGETNGLFKGMFN